MYEVIRSKRFKEQYKKLEKSQQRRIEKIEKQLEINPYIGKPLSYDFFREKRVGNLRIYYLINEKEILVIISSMSNKKNQQETIDSIKRTFEKS